MDSIKIKVSKIIDYGTVVSIVGLDLTSDLPVVVHVDHRPFEAIWEAWRKAGFPQPIAFDAENLTLNLGIDPDELDEFEEVANVPAE